MNNLANLINTNSTKISPMSLYLVGEETASRIAEDFVQQHHSIIKREKPVLKDGVWQVTVFVSSPSKTFQVRINAKTGHIIGF
ncbi:MAG: PepSY domain-containing protein [Thaumarchaeota archaeon]|nr:PepSY domain-containing protein [Nitrososphaerota archaeon]